MPVQRHSLETVPTVRQAASGVVAVKTLVLKAVSVDLDLSPIGGVWQQRLPKYHAGEAVGGQRRVAVLPDRAWPYIPEDCQAGPGDSKSFLDGELLVCSGCGLDAT